MTRLRFLPAAGIALILPGMAAAQDSFQLAQGKGCFNCHDVTGPKEAPSFKGIAMHNKGREDAAARLAEALKTGKDGHKKFRGSDAELQQLIAYILATP